MLNYVLWSILFLFIFFLIVLYLFLSANNGIFHDGGLKAYYLGLLPPKYSLPYKIITIDNSSQLQQLPILEELKYPVVFKPDDSSGGGQDVELIKNKKMALDYLKNILSKYKKIIAQEYCQVPKEYSILYEKHPLANQGKVISITEKIPVRSKTNDFTVYSVGIGNRHSDVVDHSKMITPFFSQCIDLMTKRIPNLYAGRYDVKADSLVSLLRGDFYVLELNNLQGLDLRAFTKTTSLFDRCNWWVQLRWLSQRICFGFENHLIHGPFTIWLNLYRQFKTISPYEVGYIMNIFRSCLR